MTWLRFMTGGATDKLSGSLSGQSTLTSVIRMFPAEVTMTESRLEGSVSLALCSASKQAHNVEIARDLLDSHGSPNPRDSTTHLSSTASAPVRQALTRHAGPSSTTCAVLGKTVEGELADARTSDLRTLSPRRPWESRTILDADISA